jgi:LAS superfamily LD-carboxypeptidase LdcB
MTSIEQNDRVADSRAAELESPFLDEDLLNREREPEWMAHLPALEAESPYRDAFEQGAFPVNAPASYQEEMPAFDRYEGEIELLGESWEAETTRSSPAYIRWLQQALNRIMGLQLSVDGIAGAQTRDAIRRFQEAQGLTADGKAGGQTEAALIAAGAAQPPVEIAPTEPTPAPRTTAGSALVAVEDPGGGRIQDKRDPASADLVTVTGVRGRRIQLHRLAADALSALLAAARLEGIEEPLLLPASGYRSSRRQAELFRQAVARYGSEREARKWVAPPGSSAHQSGRAIDFHLGGRNSSRNVTSLRQKPAYLWLVRNARRFGFYPYEREPWHWEYNPPMNIGAQGYASETFALDEGVPDVDLEESRLESEEEFEGERFSPREDGFSGEEALGDMEDVLENLYDEEDALYEEEEEEWLNDEGEGNLSDEALVLEESPVFSGDIWEEAEEEEGASYLEESGYTEEELLLNRENLESGEDRFDWEVLESEQNPAIPADIAEFAVSFGKEWSRRRNGSPPEEQMIKWLLQDYQDTVDGARLRWRDEFNKGRFAIGAIARAWMTSREENMKYQLLSSGSNPLVGFQPPADSVAGVSSRLIDGSDRAPVVPMMVQFVQDLRERYRGPFDVFTYRGHGGAKFRNRGYSIDLEIRGGDDRGFYPRDQAVEFLRAIHEAARANNAEWRAIYNDFSVGDMINRETGEQHVIFVGKVRRDKQNKVIGLNWHGPAPLILHFHLDLVPRSGARVSLPSRTMTAPTPVPTSAAGRPAAELVRFAQRVLNSAEGEQLKVDGDLGKLTRAALERFRSKHKLGSGGVLDAKTELALAQRALEELAQQSLFAQFGVLDTTTREALNDFKSQRGLGGTPALDERTRTALADALVGRPSLVTGSSLLLAQMLERIRSAPKEYIPPRTRRVVVDGYERAEPRADEWCRQARLTLDQGALARMVASEVSTKPPQYMLAVVEATLNQVRAAGISAFEQITMEGLTVRGKKPKSAGYFGRQTGRWCGSIQDPTLQHLEAVRVALAAPQPLVARDGRRWVDGSVMDKGQQAGKKLRNNAVTIVQKWGAEGWEWIGPVYESDGRTLLLDPYLLMIFRKVERGKADIRQGVEAMIRGRRERNVKVD